MIDSMNSSRRQILISGGLVHGGVQTHVMELCRLLAPEAAAVTIAAVASAWPPDHLDELRRRGVRIVTTPFGLGRGAWLGKAQALLTWPWRLQPVFDTLYCHGFGRMHAWMRRFVRPGGCAIYHEITDLTDGHSRPGLARMNAVIANSQPVAEQLSTCFPVRHIRTVPFLTSSSPVPPPAERPAAGPRPLRIAYLGRLVAHKQPDWLVEEWAEIAAKPPIAPARLDVYGDDRESGMLERLRRFVQARKLESLVGLHGPYTTADIPRIMAETDIVVLPSLYEGLPLVLVESMLHGVPFVATAAGGTGDFANPDVEVVPVDRAAVRAGLERLSERVRAGTICAQRLHRWADERYGYTAVAQLWREALLNPAAFFALPTIAGRYNEVHHG
jgi:glycosyltransferase involved in cell wall biosynthesis